MILVLAGTKDGRDLITLLAQNGNNVMASVFSDYGRDLIKLDNVSVHAGPLDADGLATLINNHDIHVVVDASHPYAVNVSNNAMQACNATGIKYIRYERPAALLPVYHGLHVVHDYNQAVQLSASLGKTIFLTTGSRNLKIFKNAAVLEKHRLIARVLPEPDVLAECFNLGFKPHDIVAVQGPFSHELNTAFFKEYQADVIVTKNSGQVGGSDNKITAAMALNLQIIVIDKPTIVYSRVVNTIDDVIKFVAEVKS